MLIGKELKLCTYRINYYLFKNHTLLHMVNCSTSHLLLGSCFLFLLLLPCCLLSFAVALSLLLALCSVLSFCSLSTYCRVSFIELGATAEEVSFLMFLKVCLPICRIFSWLLPITLVLRCCRITLTCLSSHSILALFYSFWNSGSSLRK